MDQLNHIVRRFDSVAEMVAAARRNARPGGEALRPPSTWSGSLTFDQACDLAEKGWTALRPLIDQTLTPVRTILSDTLAFTQERALDLVGSEVDMDRYFAGEVECMWDMVPDQRPIRVFNILCNNDASAVVSPETIANRGAAIAAIVEAFAIMGCEVNVWAEIASKGYNFTGTHSVLVNVHQAGTYLDINNLMFPIAHPAWLRRIMFGFFEGETVEVKRDFHFSGGSYGAVANPRCADLVEASIVMSASKHSKADKDPVGWVMEQLKLQGVIPSE